MGGGCGLPTGFHAVERAGVALGDTVVVQGSGPVGLNAAIFAQLSGALAVYVVGAPRVRLEAARTLGAADTLDISEVADLSILAAVDWFGELDRHLTQKQRDIAQRIRTTDVVNHLSPEAIGRATTPRERALVGLHDPFFYDA